MIKKILLFAICILFMTNIAFAQNTDTPQKELKPLKLEHNYKYGNLEKTFKNPNLNNDFYKTEEVNLKQENPLLKKFNYILYTLLILAFVFAIYVKIRKINIKNILKHGSIKIGDNNFKIISSLKLGENNSIYLIEVNDKQLVAGTTQAGVKILDSFDKDDNPDFKGISADEIPDEYIEKLFNHDDNEFKKLEE